MKNKTPNKKGEPVEEQFKNSYKDSKGYCNKDEQDNFPARKIFKSFPINFI